jgi:hypothetical protein
MAIPYPLALPSTAAVRRIRPRARNAAAVSESPLTFASQVHRWPGQAWQFDVTLRRMARSEAEDWVAFMLSLNGRAGTFLLGDPSSRAPRGSATTAQITGAAGSSSVTVSMTGTLMRGDYLQIGSGSDATLHKVLVERSGSGTLEIWPALRKARSAAVVTLMSPVGLFRLASNEVTWDIDQFRNYDVTFGATEAL